MKKLEIPYIDISQSKDTDELVQKMNLLDDFAISCDPWPAFESETKASFTIAHNHHSILLKYNVKEKYLIANETNNGNIHNDSCVEFFISFDDDGGYYNMEFNCLGFTKIGYGANRFERELLSLEAIKKLRFFSRINANMNVEEPGFEWEILLIIPTEIFTHHQIAALDGLKAKGNFYKCGDGLPQPHFLSWNMIKANEPDFHQPEYFGALEFQ